MSFSDVSLMDANLRSGELLLKMVPGFTVMSETIITLQGLSPTACAFQCLLMSNCTAINHCTGFHGGYLCELKNEAIGVSVSWYEDTLCIYYSAYNYSDLI